MAWTNNDCRLTSNIGGDFQTFSVALQYRWFNR
jgi:hypothetical protein